MDNFNNNEFSRFIVNTLLNNSPDMIFIKDIELNYLLASSKFKHLIGYSDDDDLCGKTDYDIFPKELADKYRRDDIELLKTGKSMVGKVEPLGSSRYSLTSKHIIYDDNGNAVGIYGVGRDATLMLQLEEERERYEMSSQMFDDIIEADLTANQMLRAEGSALMEMLGEKKAPSLSDTVRLIADKLILVDDRDEFERHYSADRLISDFGKGIRGFTHIVRINRGNKNRWLEVTVRLYYSRVSETVRMMAFLRDLNEEMRDKASLKKQAELDSLTGLYNRSSAIEKIKDCISGYGRDHEHALMMIDIDYFKRINDKFGHPCGDRALVAVAEKMKLLFRKDDIAGRIGGDEFIVLLKNVSSIDNIRIKAQEILLAVSEASEQIDQKLKMTCSIGIAMYRKNGKQFEQLYEQADQAMYEAKRAGKNRAGFYSGADKIG